MCAIYLSLVARLSISDSLVLDKSETQLKNVTVRSSDESRRFDFPVRVADLSKNQDLNRPSQ